MTDANCPVDFTDLKIGLALSGGGVRAAAFHLGVLRFLAEKQLMEKVCYISSVSGGTLLAGLVFSRNDYRWPSSAEFQSTVHPAIANLMKSRDIQWRYIGRLFLMPWNWFRFPFRANVLAETIKKAWGIAASLSQIPADPIWAINGTTMETGRRWRFRASQPSMNPNAFFMGDGTLGETDASDFPLSEAMATSAAFPGGISPLSIKACSRKWTIQRYVNGQPTTRDEIAPAYSKYHIADGGVYDNLGLEPLFDASKGTVRSGTNTDFLLVSDAGAPLQTKHWGFISQILGFSTRTLDIMSTQTRHLRVRVLARYFIGHPERGVFLAIEQPAKTAVERAQQTKSVCAVYPDPSKFMDEDEVKKVAHFKTTLHALSDSDFKHIEQHGYEVCKVQFALYCGIT